MSRKTTAGHRIAIVNPLTLVGKEVESLISERRLPTVGVELVETTEAPEVKLTAMKEEAAIVRPASPEAFAGVDIAFFCGEGEKNREWIENLDPETVAIDLSQPSAVASDGVPVVAGVNDAALEEADIILSPHPIAIPLALLIHSISRSFPIELCAASVIQPASEFEQAGIDELLQQAIRTLNVQSIPKKVFDRQLAFNLYPASGAATIEPYIVDQIGRIVEADVPVSVSVTQGTTFHSHSFSVFLRLGEEVDEKRLRETIFRKGVIELSEPGESYGTLEAGGRDEVLVGRVQKDPRLERSYWLWAVSDNLRRASALNAVLIAEELVSRAGPPVS